MAAEIASATLETIDMRLTLVGAPDQVTRRGDPFIAEKATVHAWPGEGGAVWVLVSGRAIKVGGQIGTLERHCVYDLVVPEGTRAYDPAAPSWLIEALKAAGVTW